MGAKIEGDGDQVTDLWPLTSKVNDEMRTHASAWRLLAQS